MQKLKLLLGKVMLKSVVGKRLVGGGKEAEAVWATLSAQVKEEERDDVFTCALTTITRRKVKVKVEFEYSALLGGGVSKRDVFQLLVLVESNIFGERREAAADFGEIARYREVT